MDGDILNLTNQGLCRIEIPNGQDPTTVILDQNNISKIDNLEKCVNLRQLSLAGNRLVRMASVSHLHQLTVLNLPNNSLVVIEGLKELTELAWLNLCGNSIKAIEGLSHNTNLRHLDLSDNSVSEISDISNLVNLKTLLLHGNILITVEKFPQYLPKSIVILSLAENEITDLNQVSFLSSLPNLEQLSLMNNPCVLMAASSPGFDGRPFIINWCPGLQVLDGYVVSEKERLKAEWLYSQGRGRHFQIGEHVNVVQYLETVCPLTASSQLESQEDAKLSHILNKQRQHQQQLSKKRQPGQQCNNIGQQCNNISVDSHTESYCSTETGKLVNTQTSQKSSVSHRTPDRAPLKAWSSTNDHGSAHSSYQRSDQQRFHGEDLKIQDVNTEDYDTRSQTSLLDSESIYLPVGVTPTPNRPMTAPVVTVPTSLANYSFFMPQDNRPATATENRYEAYDRRPIKPMNPDMFKGLTRPSFQYSPPTQSGNEPAQGTKKKTPPTAQAHDYDTSQEVSQIEQILHPPKQNILKEDLSQNKDDPPKENIPTEELSKIKDVADRKARRSASQKSSSDRRHHRSTNPRSDRPDKGDSSKSNIPVSRTSSTLHRTQSDSGKYAERSRKIYEQSDKNKRRSFDRKTENKNNDSGVWSRPNSDAVLDETLPEVHKAATLIQSVWRGYWTREHQLDVLSVRKEIRARRAEDHIVVLRSELDRQRKMYDEERHLRSLQLEAIRYLWKEVQSLQSWKSEVLTSQQFKTMESSRQDDSYNYSQEIQHTLERMETMNKTGESGRGTISSALVDLERQKELEKTCANLQKQVEQLNHALQSVSSVVFQSGIMASAMDTTDSECALLVTGYEDDEVSSCDESTSIGVRWGTVPHSLSPYPSEEEEQYFHTVPQPGFPTPPRNLQLEHKGENSIVVAWQPSKILDGMNREMNKPLLGYRVYVDEKPMAMITQGMTKALIHGLNPRATYKIYVRAISALGESNTSNILMTALSVGSTNSVRKRSSSSDSNPTDEDSDKDLDSTESSDVIRHRKEVIQRQKRRIKSPRQEKRRSHGKESSASDQDSIRERPSSTRSERPSSSRSNSNTDGIFVQPKLHTHKRSKSRDLPNKVPDLDLIGVQREEAISSNPPPPPLECNQSPQAGTPRKVSSTSISASKMSETFTVDTSGSLLQAISNAQGALGMTASDNSEKEQSVKTHRRKRSKDLKMSEIIGDNKIQNSDSVSHPNVTSETQAPKGVASDRELLHKSESDLPTRDTQVQGHRRTRSKDYEWRKDIDNSSTVSGNKDIRENKDIKKAWVKEAPSTGEVHGIPVIDARKRHSSGSRPSSPAPSDLSERSQPERKRTVADMLFSTSKTSSNFSSSGTLGGADTSDMSALPPRQRKMGSNEDVSSVSEQRRTPTKNLSPSYIERRRTPSNGSESDLSEISTSSAARQLDMDRKATGSSGIVSKLLQKLQTFSKTQEETLQQRSQKMKKKSTGEGPGAGSEDEHTHRRQRKTSGSESESVSERHLPHSDSGSSQSDDPQMGKKPYKTHRRSGSDQRVQVTYPTSAVTRDSSAPSTPSRHSNQSSPGGDTQPESTGDLTPRSQSNVKRTASFHGVTPSTQHSVKPRRTGSEENLYDKKNEESQGSIQMQPSSSGLYSRRQRQVPTSSPNVQHIPILSGAQLQKQQKPPAS